MVSKKVAGRSKQGAYASIVIDRVVDSVKLIPLLEMRRKSCALVLLWMRL